MPSSFTYVVIHYIFATKNREMMIDPDLRERLYPFVGGIVRNRGASLIAVGGMPDHIHMLVRMGPENSTAEIMRHAKSRSSEWVHKTFPPHQRFGWQDGCGAFSTNKDGVEAITRYIHNQELHHRDKLSLAEFTQYLDAHGLEFELKYL